MASLEKMVDVWLQTVDGSQEESESELEQMYRQHQEPCPGCAAAYEKLRLCGSDQALADVIYDMVQVDKAQQLRITALEQERDAFLRQNGGLQESLDIRDTIINTYFAAIIGPQNPAD